MRHFLEVDDLTSDELARVLDLSVEADVPRVLEGRGVALAFVKPSARTRNSMEMAVSQLGGHPVTIRNEEVGFDVRETVEDVTRTLACYHAAIGARVFEHDVVERMAATAVVPIVNMLSDEAHPLQALADLLTIRQEFGDLKGRRVAYVGDANNVARSLGVAAGLAGIDYRLATPPDFAFSEAELDRLRTAGADPLVTTRPEEAVEGAEVVYTDVWTSMGQEAEVEARRRAFADFTVDAALVDRLAPDGIVLHCLPAHRGEEVTAQVIDGPRSRVWAQAENRMHTARGLLAWLLGEA